MNDYYDDLHQRECYDCEQLVKSLDRAQLLLREVIYQLFTHDPLNTEALEVSLENLCDVLCVPMPQHSIAIKRSINYDTYPTYLKQWVEWNKNYLKSANS